MARIFLSTAGEGRGHATRTRALAEQLRQQHELTIFAPHHAHDLLAPLYAGSTVRVERISGICGAYRNRTFDTWGTVANVVRYAAGARSLIRRLCAAMRERRPDLAITDFEPALPRAAIRCGVPCVSVDHQHFALVSDLSCLPRALQQKLWLIRLAARVVCPRPVERVVSSFYFPPLKPDYAGDVTQVGVLIRPEVREAARAPGEHLVVYVRRFAPPNLLEALARCGREVRIYGLGSRPAQAKLSFHPLDARAFVADLATSHALVSTAGNQIVGEALYLGKPVLAMPEAGNFEQCINAHFVAANGIGDQVPLEECRTEHLRRFCDRADVHRAHIDTSRIDGTMATMDVLQRRLGGTVRTARPGARQRPGATVTAR